MMIVAVSLNQLLRWSVNAILLVVFVISVLCLAYLTAVVGAVVWKRLRG